MDAIVFVLVKEWQNWECEIFEAGHSSRLREMGVAPIAYKWNEHISLLPRPVPCELVKYTLGSESLWRCYVIVGDFLERIEEEVNHWVDELDVVDSGFYELIRMIFLSSSAAILAFEPQGERVDFFYDQRCADWVFVKIKSVLNRKKKLEGFVVIGCGK